MRDWSYPEVPPELGHWLAGLIDGEGCFSIHPNGPTSWAAHFYMTLRADDEATLVLAQQTTGLGRIYDHRRSPNGGKNGNNKPVKAWTVYRLRDKLRLTQVLDEYPLRSKKARDYAIWREAVFHLARFGGRGKRLDTSVISDLSQQLRQVRAYDARTLRTVLSVRPR